ncbi:MAG: PAS domain-containing sensor histidine kinase [Thermodesulfobacteriota bacterium]|nr:PAS domain-containing sensor histidine kinase [Thermodesulfobacteriota bacterium]
MADKSSGMVKEKGEYSSDLAFYRFIIDSLPTGVITVNADLKITGFNPWAERLTGYSSEEALGQFCGTILRGGMCDSYCPLMTVLSGHKPVSLATTSILNKWGETIPIRMSTAGLFDGKGSLIGGVEAFQDISRLRKLEREKENIVSMFAHDMKSSLTIIGGFALRLLKKGGKIDEKKVKKYLGIIKDESGKLESLVNDFLEFSKLQTGKLKLNFSATSLDKELMELLDAYWLKASQSGIELVLENEEELSIIEADASQLRRVFTNLLDNAIKFSSEKGTITISTNETAEDVIVKVKDEGIGITHDQLPFIFDSFHQVRRGREVEGFGLGLAAVKTIVEGHSGKIFAESELGKGSVFTLVLPKIQKVDGKGDM